MRGHFSEFELCSDHGFVAVDGGLRESLRRFGEVIGGVFCAITIGNQKSSHLGIPENHPFPSTASKTAVSVFGRVAYILIKNDHPDRLPLVDDVLSSGPAQNRS